MAVLDFPSAIGPVQEAIQKDPGAGTLQQMVLGEFGSRQQGMADQAAMAREMLKSKDAIAQAAALKGQRGTENLLAAHQVIKDANYQGRTYVRESDGKPATPQDFVEDVPMRSVQTAYSIPERQAIFSQVPVKTKQNVKVAPGEYREEVRKTQHPYALEGFPQITPLQSSGSPTPSPAKPTMPSLLPVKPRAAATTTAPKAAEIPYATKMADLMAGRPPRRASEGTKVNTEIVDLAPEDKDRIFKVIEAHPRYAGKIAAVHGLTADGNYVWVQMKGEDGEPKRLSIESLKNR
jgi:hypothetical protein